MEMVGAMLPNTALETLGSLKRMNKRQVSYSPMFISLGTTSSIQFCYGCIDSLHGLEGTGCGH